MYILRTVFKLGWGTDKSRHIGTALLQSAIFLALSGQITYSSQEELSKVGPVSKIFCLTGALFWLFET